MKPLTRIILRCVLLALCISCAGTDQEIPVLSHGPTRPYTVLGTVHSEGDQAQAVREARKLGADALVVTSSGSSGDTFIQPRTSSALDGKTFGPPRTVHAAGGSVIEVGGAFNSFEHYKGRYVAIKWDRDGATTLTPVKSSESTGTSR